MWGYIVDSIIVIFMVLILIKLGVMHQDMEEFYKQNKKK